MLLCTISVVVFLLLLLVHLQTQVLASTRPWPPSSPSPPPPPPMVAKQGCKDKCGNLTIPYPFGIGDGCYFDKPFEITCNDSAAWYVTNSNVKYSRVFDISMDTFRIESFFFPFPYNKSTGKSIYGDEPIDGTFKEQYVSLSATGNRFMAVGCDIYAYIKDTESGEIVSGCASFCNTNSSSSASTSCTGNNGCCKSVITRIPEKVTVSIQTMNTKNASWTSKSCSYMALAYDGDFSSYKISKLLDANPHNCEGDPAALTQAVNEWVIGNMSCEQAMKSPKYACQKNSDCVNSPNIGYRCRCSKGYQGNPYISNGCQDIDECASTDGTHCPQNTHCFNIPGGFYCEPNNRRRIVWQLCLGIAAAAAFISLFLACILLRRQIKKWKEKQAKQEFFKRNGGLLLQQQISINEGSGSNLLHMKLFLKEELEKATDNFNESRILGKGGLGTVYKGMLTDGCIVAIKKSNVLTEDQAGLFVNEIFILSQINHRHIVKVLGCCLETQVPLLVYEYISNGTLAHHLHGNSRTPDIALSWEHRLRIAREIAGALSYMHSCASSAIFHRDIKSSNILLDENYRAVVSDFGLSRLVPIDKTHLTTKVGGTFGYLDPEYFHSGQLNDKSDVYAFGVVLLELLTSERAVSSDSSESLAMRFRSVFKQGRLLEIVDKEIAREVEGQEVFLVVATLAKRCLKRKAKNRPSMQEVAAALNELSIQRRRQQLNELSMSRYNMPHADSFQYNFSFKSESFDCGVDYV